MEAQKAITTVQKIRTLYPDYRSASDEDVVNEYCVGGAVCRYAQPLLKRLWYDRIVGYAGKDKMAFPDVPELSDALRELNPELSLTASLSLADDIIIKNDDHCFNEAWDSVCVALSCPEVSSAEQKVPDDASNQPAETCCGTGV